MSSPSTPMELVCGHLKEKNVPMSVRKIASDLNLKKRSVLAMCHQAPELSVVDPSWCGSGRNHGSLFVYSNDPKWLPKSREW